MRRALLAAVACCALTGCPAARSAACGARTPDTIQAGFDTASDRLIDSGACDAHALVEDCPEWRALRLAFDPLYAAWERCE